MFSRKYFKLISWVVLLLVIIVTVNSIATKPSSITASNHERYTFTCFEAVSVQAEQVSYQCDNKVVNENRESDLFYSPLLVAKTMPNVTENKGMLAIEFPVSHSFEFNLVNIQQNLENTCSHLNAMALYRQDRQQKPYSVVLDKDFEMILLTQKKGESIEDVVDALQLSEAQKSLIKKTPVRKEALSDRQFYLLLDKQYSLKAVKVVRDDQSAEFVLIKDKDKLRFANKEGDINSLSFLRYPVNYSKINSKFNLRRKHPVTKRLRPHKGVDFKAKYGALVWSTQDGVVTFAGRQRGYGLIVEVDHQNGYKTKYAHLSKIAKGIKKGKRVNTKQTIAYVGNSGLSTGTHLHYEVLVNGKAKNPLKVELPIAKKLSEELKKRINTYLPKLNEMIKNS